MLYKNSIFIGIVVVLLLIAVIMLTKRRDLPFQEIVPLDSGIAVINAGKWYNDKLTIKLGNNGNPNIRNYSASGICIFKELTNDMKYSIEIERTDIKGFLLYKKLKKIVTPTKKDIKYIVLVGASIGDAWKFDRLNNRIKLNKDIFFGSRTKYDFDKTNELEGVINLPIPNKTVIIKECSAYFPRNIDTSSKQIMSWVEKLKINGVTPILATAVPVTNEHDKQKPGRHEFILKYNDFIRSYGDKEEIVILDLEKALRVSNENRHLKEIYALPDGNHVNTYAYRVLDQLVKEQFDLKDNVR